MSLVKSNNLNNGAVLAAPVNLIVPARSPKRPSAIVLTASKDALKNGNDDDLFDDVSSAEFFLEGQNSPRDSLFSLNEPNAPRRQNFAFNETLDKIDDSEIEFFLDEMLELQVCQIDDLISIQRWHDEWDSQTVQHIRI